MSRAMEQESTEEIPKALAQRRGPGSARHRNVAIAVVAGALVLTGLFGIGLIPRLQTQKAVADIAKDNHPIVSVIPAMRGNAATEVNLPGTLLPYQETPIYARTNGYVKPRPVDSGPK